MINNNLQQQAMVLFTKLISSPLSAKNANIGDYCSVKSGFAFKSSWWTDKGIRVVKIKSIENDALNLAECSFVSEDKAKYATDFSVCGGDLLIAMTGATIGKFAIVPKVTEQLLVNQRVGKFFLGKDPLARLPFTFCTLKQPDIISEIINRGQGSAQPNISGSDIMSVPCYLPEKAIVDKFNSLCRPIFESIVENQFQNRSLSILRDTILPKLMNGEIDVSEVEI
ncbi:MAG: restriction endonuclease subunit S [Clostridia bacterium]|nr:restriction endonuclease subunit S [Clostridia bacterium]